MSLLVFVEERRGVATQDSLGLVSHASGLGLPVCAAVCGSAVRAVAEEVLSYGAECVLLVDSPQFRERLAGAYVDAVALLVRERWMDAVLLATSVLASEIAGALSSRLGAGLNWDLVDLQVRDGHLVGTKPVLGDTARVEVCWAEGIEIGLFRGGSFEASRGERVGDIIEVSVALKGSERVRVLERWEEEGKGRRIEEAEIVVGVGRGIGDRQTLEQAEELAEALRGALAVTMPIVDRGWYSYANQVGQTGKTVRPRLYLACGISGAMQHRVGMEHSGTVVAINTDAHAPIFGFCDFGLVGDVREVIPRLTELLRARPRP